eukprot:scaffold51317_cov53-Attheya_sp.AAC.1
MLAQWYIVRAPNPSPMASGMVGLRDFGPSASTGSQVEPMQLPIANYQSVVNEATHFHLVAKRDAASLFLAVSHSTSA